jgi:hypothetical protein
MGQKRPVTQEENGLGQGEKCRLLPKITRKKVLQWLLGLGAADCAGAVEIVLSCHPPASRAHAGARPACVFGRGESYIHHVNANKRRPIRASMASSIATLALFTKTGCCSVGYGRHPHYWNLDAEEDVVRTPLSDESKMHVSLWALLSWNMGTSDHVPLPRWMWPLVRPRPPKPIFSPQSPLGP